MKKIKIYSKTGDAGETGLWGGGRTGKDDFRIHAYGTVDECGAVLGIVRTCSHDKELNGKLGKIQNLLFILGSDMATPSDVSTAIDRISAADVELLESWIDAYEEELPELKQFIIQGGNQAAAYLHLARTVCRRAERWSVATARTSDINREVIRFLNRLSDFLFVASRVVNARADIADIPWDNPRLKKN